MIIEVGRLTNEVELKKVDRPNGEISVLNNRIAVFQGKGHTTFINITAWGGMAEFIAEKFKKGDEIYVEGSIRNKRIKVSDDRSIQSIYINVNSVKLVFGKRTPKEQNQNEE